MVLKINYHKSDCVGVYMKLTNTFCAVPHDVSENFYETIKNELRNKVPIVKISLIGSRSIGRLIVGNKNGIIVPYETSFEEFVNLRNTLPENIIIKRCEEQFSTLSNSICVNDYVALTNPEISAEFTNLISDVLGVETFKISVGKENLVGSYCVFNNNGGLVHPGVSCEEQDELTSLLEIPLLIGTVNCGSKLLGSGVSTNDFATFCGLSTTQSELLIIETAFKKKKN
jgi:translation initiation factor 6